MKNKGSIIAGEIDMEYRMKKVYTCPKCIFYDKENKKCKEKVCQNRKWNKTL
mgnify:FL=1